MISAAVETGAKARNGKKILIACFSNTGNTLRVAKVIRRITGGTLCVIYPWQPYPSEYCKLKKQAEKEIRENHRPRLLPFETIPEGYDVIFIGTPCWRGRISPPAASFLERIQTDGKIVIPFCTHTEGKNVDVWSRILPYYAQTHKYKLDFMLPMPVETE